VAAAPRRLLIVTGDGRSVQGVAAAGPPRSGLSCQGPTIRCSPAQRLANRASTFASLHTPESSRDTVIFVHLNRLRWLGRSDVVRHFLEMHTISPLTFLDFSAPSSFRRCIFCATLSPFQ
jgi:hypothetical protein